MEATFLVGARELAVFLRALFGIPDCPVVAHPGDGPDDLDFSFGPQRSPFDGVDPMPLAHDVVIGDGPLPLTIRATHRGRPAKFDSPPTVAVDDPSLFSADVAFAGPGSDTATIRFNALGPPGTTGFNVSVPVGHDEGQATKTLSGTLNAVAPDIDALEGEFGDQEAPEPAPTAGPGTPESGGTAGEPPTSGGIEGQATA